MSLVPSSFSVPPDVGRRGMPAVTRARRARQSTQREDENGEADGQPTPWPLPLVRAERAWFLSRRLLSHALSSEGTTRGFSRTGGMQVKLRDTCTLARAHPHECTHLGLPDADGRVDRMTLIRC